MRLLSANKVSSSLLLLNSLSSPSSGLLHPLITFRASPHPSSSRLYTAATGWLHNTQPASASPSFSSSLPPPVVLLHGVHSAAVVHKAGDQNILVTEHIITVPLKSAAAAAAAAASGAASGADGTTSPSDSDTIDVSATVLDCLSPGASSDQILAFLNAPSQTPASRASSYTSLLSQKASKSLLFLQGGPGFPSPRPNVGLSLENSWASAALEDSNKFTRLVLLDQRGTGRSSAVTRQSLEIKFGPVEQWVPSQVAAHLRLFRADSIVSDGEAVRAALGVADNWAGMLGQSFGGFVLASHLSTEGLAPPDVALFTGGIPPVGLQPKEVYDRLWHKVAFKNDRYYDKFPGDVAVVKRIVRALVESGGEALPGGGTLTARRFLQLGLGLGGGPGSFESLHELLATAFLSGSSSSGGGDVVCKNFLRAVERAQPFDTNPLYCLLHESIYCNGEGEGSRWAAHRSLKDDAELSKLFDYEEKSREGSADEDRVLFYGEMVFPWMLEDYAELKGMEEVAEELAEWREWGALYGEEKGVATKKNGAAAACYFNDMYVDLEMSVETTGKGGLLEGVETFVTSEYEHSGLRDDGKTIFNKLYSMAQK